MEKKYDKRYRETDQLIKDVFIQLVETRGYSNVTVKDIANRAQINRNTFYLHYRDKEDLIDKITLTIFNESYEKVKEINEIRELSTEKGNEIALTNFMKSIYHHIEFFRILLKDPNLTGYFYNFQRNLIRYFTQKYSDKSIDSRITIEYKLSGFFGVMIDWIIYDRYSINDIVYTFSKILFE